MRTATPAAIIFFACVLAYDASATTVRQATVRYDGLYVCREGRYQGYLRFYPDGDVVSAGSAASPRQVARWLRKRFHYFSEDGTYRLRRDRIAMQIHVHSYGTVKWVGRVGPQSLALSAYSRVTRRRETRQYQFVPVVFGDRKV